MTVARSSDNAGHRRTLRRNNQPFLLETQALVTRHEVWAPENKNSRHRRFLYKFPPHRCLSGESVSESLNQNGSWCERLYDANARQLVLYGRALGLSHSEAEDVLQETFVALLKRDTPPEQPEHYCIRSFRNRALNYRRSLWRRVFRELESARWFERSDSETPQERLAMHQLATLPVDQREVIVLKIWHQYTFEQIGSVLDISPNTAAGRYRYGLQKLKASLQGDTYERLDERLDSIGTPLAFLDPAGSGAKG
jgi:RNA polymerase sigma-70 factor, ECF subfamily